MKKLNKKGTSLIELLVSIALISVVLVFMFKLLLDVNNEITNNTFAKDNQINRAEILRTIENDLNTTPLSGMNNSGNLESRVITFYFKGGTSSTLTLTEKKITYRTKNGTTRAWEMKNCTLYTKKINVYMTKTINNPKIFSMILDIEIHTINEENTEGHNNILDDIAISYVGNVDDIPTDKQNALFNLNCIGACT